MAAYATTAIALLCCCSLAFGPALAATAVEKKSGNAANSKVQSGSQPSVAVVQWTDDDDVKSAPAPDRDENNNKNNNSSKTSNSSVSGKKRPLAFRDLVVEKTGQRIFERFMDKVGRPKVYGRQILRDPMPLSEGIDLRRKTPAYDIALKVDNMWVRGLRKLRLTYIRVIRHYGLRDIKVNLRMGTDLVITGHYNLTGSALKFLPVAGEGPFRIDINGFTLSAVTFIASKPGEKSSAASKADQGNVGSGSRLVIRELEVQVDYKDVKFHFENMLGGGVIGSAVNVVINAMGEAIIETQRAQIVNLMKTGFKEQVSAFI